MGGGVQVICARHPDYNQQSMLNVFLTWSQALALAQLRSEADVTVQPGPNVGRSALTFEGGPVDRFTSRAKLDWKISCPLNIRNIMNHSPPNPDDFHLGLLN